MKKLTNSIFIKRSKKSHGDKYDYSKVNYIDCYTKVIIICPKHGEFEQLPRFHLEGKGCKKCGGSEKLTTEEFINKANKIHNNKYDYSKVNYINNSTKVTIICPVHGKFEQISNSHLSGKGCKKCGGTEKLTTEEFINKANKIHNNKYDYSKVKLVNVRTKIVIICPVHGIFEQTPNCHLNGNGCKKCVNSVSKLSQKWLDGLNISIREKIIKLNNKNYIVDGYNPKTNTIYEFYGDFWHGNLGKFNKNDINPINKKTYGELYKLTAEKEKLIKNAGYNLITIWESDWNLKEDNVK